MLPNAKMEQNCYPGLTLIGLFRNQMEQNFYPGLTLIGLFRNQAQILHH